jgi:predicted dehydrogenase
MTKRRFGVGIVGMQPEKTWGAVAHLPALRSLPEDFEVVGVANRSRASAQKAAAAYNIPRAFEDVSEMVAAPEIDIVAVTMRVPYHLEVVTAALEAGKHVYCEWPLGNGLAEARQMADLARAKGLLGVCGSQARVEPEIDHLRRLIEDGFVGEVLSSTLVASGGTWGTEIDEANAYVLDRANGATMLTIPFGHTLFGVCGVLGPITELSARLANRRTSGRIIETGAIEPMTAHDQVLVEGLLASGAPISIHYRGGLCRGTNLLWEINGTEGDIQITGPVGYVQWAPLTILGARRSDTQLQSIALAEPAATASPKDLYPKNVARTYSAMAADLRHGTHTAPNFDAAVALHQLIDAVEESDRTGRRISVGAR